MPIIFVKPRHDYGSYQDYWTLVNLAGYRWVYEDEIDIHNAAHCYIFTWFSCQSDFAPDAKARLICWNLEWANNPILPNVEYWTPDAGYAAQQGWHYVPVGSDKRLRLGSLAGEDDAKLYDVTLQMYRDPQRRAHIIHRMRDAGLQIAPDGWNEQRHHSLMHSRCQVHIHQFDDNPAISPLRLAVAAAYHLPVISEALTNAGILKNTVIQSPYHDLPTSVVDYLKPERAADLQRFADALHTRLCQQYTFKCVIEAAV